MGTHQLHDQHVREYLQHKLCRETRNERGWVDGSGLFWIVHNSARCRFENAQAMSAGATYAGEMRLKQTFFEEFEVTGECLEFCVDKARFLKMIKLGRDKEWMKMVYDEESRRMMFDVMGRKGNVTSFESIYYHADYGAGFVTSKRNYSNLIVFQSGEFGGLLDCFVEWPECDFAVSCRRKFQRWKMMFEFGDRMYGTCKRTYWGFVDKEKKDDMFFLPEVFDFPPRVYGYKRLRTTWNKMKMKNSGLVILSVGHGEPLKVGFHVGDDAVFQVYVPPKTMEERLFF